MQMPLHLLCAVKLLLVGWNINTGIFNFDAYSHRAGFMMHINTGLVTVCEFTQATNIYFIYLFYIFVTLGLHSPMSCK